MNAVINTSSEYKPNNLRKKPSFRRDGSYRIFHITKKQKEDSDDEDICVKSASKENDSKGKPHKKSFKNGFDGWKRKSTKNKRLFFLPKSSYESNQLSNDLSQSIISSDAQPNHLLKKNKQYRIDESSESDALGDVMHKTFNHDDATLDDLLARADKLATTVKTPDFNKVQPIKRTKSSQRRKHFLIACGTILILLTIIISIIIFVLIMTLKHKEHMKQVPQSSSILDQHR